MSSPGLSGASCVLLTPGLSGETVDNQEPTPALPAMPQAQQLQMTNHFHLSQDSRLPGFLKLGSFLSSNYSGRTIGTSAIGTIGSISTVASIIGTISHIIGHTIG